MQEDINGCKCNCIMCERMYIKETAFINIKTVRSDGSGIMFLS